MMCRVLDVSVSGYYAWKKRPLCARTREDGELTRRITHAFITHRRVYGSPRIQVELRVEGIRCGRNRIARLMRQAQLCARPRPAQRKTTQSDPTASARVAPNVLNREFSAPAASAQVGSGCHVHTHPPGVAVPGSGPRFLLAHGRWLGHGCQR
jgi:putative transposase